MHAARSQAPPEIAAAIGRLRVPWDTRGTSIQSEDFFLFGRLRFLEPGSIPAASTNSHAEAATDGLFCGAPKTRIRCKEPNPIQRLTTGVPNVGPADENRTIGVFGKSSSPAFMRIRMFWALN